MSVETPTTGYAALGLVMGQRFDDGTRPEFVRVRIERDDARSNVIVRRTVPAQSVEFDDTDTVRFLTRGGDGWAYADRVISAEPIRGDDL